MNFLHQYFEHILARNAFINKVIILSIVFFSLHFTGFSQVLEELDAISPLNEELVAIKKGNAWAFVNEKGVKVIDFREDLVASQIDNALYPTFVEGKCLIKKLLNDEYFYGYINKEGATIIEPQYLNATNFTNGYAMVIKLDKSKMGNNNVLGKEMINSKLEEYVIDASGKIIKFLDNSRGYIPSTTGAQKAPLFKSKFIAPHMAAVKNNDGKWTIYTF